MENTDTATTTPDAPPLAQTPDLTAMIPYQGSPESVDVNAPSSPEPQTQPTPDLTATIPSETPPNNPDIERQYHEAWWRHALGKVADVMTDNETWHVRHDPKTGEISATRDPSTLGEKWGRIAATALGGAAAGLANAQGPGGLAKATAAGTQFGLEQPQKQQQQAQQQVDFQNKQLLAKATRMHLTQENWMLAKQAQELDLKMGQDSADSLNKWYAAVTSNPGAKDLGPIDPTDPKEPMKSTAKDPQIMDAMLQKGNKKLVVMMAPDHKLHKVITDQTMEERKIDTPMPAFYIGAGADGKPALLSKDAPAGGPTFGELTDHNLATVTKWNTARKADAEADKAENDAKKPPTAKTPTEASLAWDAQNNPDPAERAKAKRAVDLMKEKSGTGTEELSGYDPKQTAQTNAEMMVDGLSSPSLMSKRGKEYNQLLPLAQAYSMKQYGQQFDAEISEARYQARKEVLKEFAGGKPADQIQSFQAFTNHAQDLMNDTAQFRTTNVKLLNMAYNKIRDLAGSPDVTAVKTHVEALRHEYQNFLSNNLALKGDEIKEGKGILADTNSPAQIEQAVKSFMETAIGRVSALNNRALRFQVPIGGDILTPANQQTIRDLGLGDYANRMIKQQPRDPQMFQGGQQPSPQAGSGSSPAPQPQTPPAPAAQAVDQSNPPPIEKVPPGHDTTFGNGQVWRNTNGKLLRVK